MNESALICVNGALPQGSILNAVKKHCSITVCTDGAANKALDKGLTPDVIVGDLDSLTQETRKALKDKSEIIFKPDQNSTDLEKALQFVVERNYHNVTLTGIKGGRIDHSITNLCTLHKLSSKLAITLFDEDGCGALLKADHKPIRLELPISPVDTVVSLISFTDAHGLRTTGLKYNLHSESLSWGIRDGQSNQVSEPPAQIEMLSGSLFVFVGQSKWYENESDPKGYFELD